MAGVIPNVAETIALNYLCNKDAPEDLVLKLFTNDVTPDEASTHASFTEATEAGYAAKTINGAGWTVTAGDPSQAAAAEQTFAITEAGSFYGYYIVRATTGDLVAAERFSGAPYVLPAGGGEINVTPTLTAS